MSRKPDPADVVIVRYPTLPPNDKPALLLIDKPKGITSFTVVKRVRHLTQIRKVGHSGTLDPMATGLLILLLAKATRLMDPLLKLGKSYEGTIRLGEQTPSFDAETPVSNREDTAGVTNEMIRDAAKSFVGSIEQETPVYSAVKLGGERLYKKARRGDRVVLPRRIVTVDDFRITAINGRDIDFVVDCGSGTYVRVLANDMGKILGVGGHLIRLRRTQIGNYSVADAWRLSELEGELTTPSPATGG